ncbi:MAG TPA: hypothetical protein VF772_06710 [Terriglobales bacterium]
MPAYLCRWPNGDVSLAAGESEVEVADVLDEVDNPDAAELMQLDHAIAVHFKLGTVPDQEGTLPLRFEDMSEQLESSIYERAYPVYNEVRTKPDATAKELTEALEHEKNPIYRKAPEPSSNPAVASLQEELQMPRVVLEHLAGGAAATEGVPGQMSTEDIRDMICNPVYCLDRVAPWIAEPPGPLVPVEQWVAAGAKLIEEIGAEAYLRQLIQNLRGE